MKLHIKKFGTAEAESMAVIDIGQEPSPTIMAMGLGGVGHGQYWIERDVDMADRINIDANRPSPTVLTHNRSGTTMLRVPNTTGPQVPQDKPPYRVPLMTELPTWNGLKAISTFSGCGGSSLGYKMAGYKVLWASEFIPAAAETYRINHPGTILDTRDIRAVTPEEILTDCNLSVGELDLLDGSPPCSSFSTAGKRAKGWGKVKKYSDSEQRTDDLFPEYTRLLRGLQPKVFVAENVSGLVKGVAKGYFLNILAELKAAGYKVTCRVLDAQWLGVPQMRQRTIFVGVRNDLPYEPVHPKPLPYRYSVRDALPWIGEITNPAHGYTKENDHDVDEPAATIPASGGAAYTGARILLPPSRQKPDAFNTTQVDPDKPVATVTTASPGNDLAVPVPGSLDKRKFTIPEVMRLCAFPDDFILTGSYNQQWERLGRAVPPVMMYHVAKEIRDRILLCQPA